MVDWDVEVGETLLRKELHDRWGGGRYGGMEPSVKAESVFLFSNPSAGEAFGYKYDGWPRTARCITQETVRSGTSRCAQAATSR